MQIYVRFFCFLLGQPYFRKASTTYFADEFVARVKYGSGL